ncbi:MAG: adenylosuccinate synthase [Sandaracinus sp.]
MSVVVVVGAQWGDEGKGKVVDLLTKGADVVARYGGGANAGHTLVVGGEKTVIRLVPSGVLHPTPVCVLGPGMVIDPAVLLSELDTLASRGVLDAHFARVVISDRAHLVLPHHVLIDQLRESGPGAIGTTKRGVGPAYEDKVARRGVRAIDLVDTTDLEARVRANVEAWTPTIRALGGQPPDAAEIVRELRAHARRLAPLVKDTAEVVHAAKARGARILLEGAQGTMLDVDHGTYPHVTSSTVLSGGAASGAGLAPTDIDRVVGITKAYTTRVGGGPFPSEMPEAEAERLRKAGGEFGAVTGRPRRCGWLDIPVLRHAVRANGLTMLALTKLDVLRGWDPIQLVVAYERDGQRLERPPASGLDRVRPVYESLPGWTEDLTGCRTMDDLPSTTRAFIERVEALTGCQVAIVSVGPDRAQTIVRADVFA